MTSIRSSIRASIRTSIRSSFSAGDPFATALALYDDTTIIGSAPVTEWRNRGTGGSAFDLNVVLGAVNNLTTDVLNGLTGIKHVGNAGLETTAGQTINFPSTIFAVFKPSDASPSLTQRIFDARSNANARVLLFTNGSGTNEFSFYQGSSIFLSEAYDINLRVITVQANGDSTSKLTVSDVGSVTGDAGSDNWDFGTIFTGFDELLNAPGLFMFFAVFDEALSESQITQIQDFLVSKYGAGTSAEVQAVFDRMSALDQTEKDAIETLVDGLVSDGSYSDITEIYAPCLNATDFLTGFKFMTLQPSASAPVHTAGEYVEFSTNAMHYLDSANFDSFATLEGFVGVYNVFTGADTTGNSDLFGVADAGGRECYMRWRGTDTNDFNALYNVTLATPRTAANTRPTGDVVGMGLEGLDVFNLSPGGIISKATRITEGVPTTHPFQWHGQNLSGSPAAGNMANSRYSFMLHSNSILSTVAQGSIRARVLQFLRDIGVSGIPVT